MGRASVLGSFFRVGGFDGPGGSCPPPTEVGCYPSMECSGI